MFDESCEKNNLFGLKYKQKVIYIWFKKIYKKYVVYRKYIHNSNRVIYINKNVLIFDYI